MLIRDKTSKINPGVAFFIR